MLRGFEALLKVPKIFSKCSSKLLLTLSQHPPEGKFPNMKDILNFFQVYAINKLI